MSKPHEKDCICLDCATERSLHDVDKITGSEMPWSEIHAFVKRLVKEPRGQRRAANLIREIANELAHAEACEDLANAATEMTRMLVLSWELRWDKARKDSE